MRIMRKLIVATRTTIVVTATLVALAGCEEAAPPTTQATGPPTTPATAAPSAQVVELVIAADTAQSQQRVDQTTAGGDAARSHTVTFPDGFNPGERYDETNNLARWYRFVSKPIPNVLTNAEVLRMSGISLDNGQAWYLASLEITPDLWVNIRAVIVDRETPGASAMLVVSVHTDDTYVGNLDALDTSVARASNRVLAHLATNAIRLRLAL